MSIRSSLLTVGSLIIYSGLTCDFSSAQCIRTITNSKISSSRGYFTGPLDNNDLFGVPAYLGDLNGDGIGDLAVSAVSDDDGGTDRGAVWILFLDRYGRVKSHQKISSTQGNFGGSLSNVDYFGYSLAAIGDQDGDGIVDLAVGVPNDNDGGSDRGAVYILFLNANGTVKSTQKISDTQGSFTGTLQNGDRFGAILGPLGDLDGDGFGDLAVGAPNDDDGGSDRGAVWILFLDSSGTVLKHQKISDTVGNFTGVLDNGDLFGYPYAVGDLNGDGITELAVGAPYDDDGGSNRGAVWILFLDTNGKVKSHQKVSSTSGGFMGSLSNNDSFGSSIRPIGDLDHDGFNEIAVGGIGDDDGGTDRGAFWILNLNSSGTVKGSFQKISDIAGNFVGILDNADYFGYQLSFMQDFNGDGYLDIAVSAHQDDDGGSGRGAVWILSLGPCATGCWGGFQKRFEKVYKAPDQDRGHSIIKTKGGGYAICGTTDSYGAGALDWFVMKIRDDGDTLWARTYGGSSDETGHSLVIKQTADSGFLLAGRAFSFAASNGEVLILKLNKDGTIQWQKIVTGNANEHARDLELTHDGGFILSGTNGYILKFDSTGNMQWTRYFSGGGNMHMVTITEIMEKREYLAVGEATGYGQGGRSAYLIYMDSSGNKKWERIYDNTYQDAYVSAVQTEGKEFLLVGTSHMGSSANTNRILVMKLDSIGKFIWSRSYSSGLSSSTGGVLERGVHVLKGLDGGYLFSGYSEKISSHRNVLLKIDDYGNVEWGKLYPGNSVDIQTYFGENLEYSYDGGYVFVNYYQPPDTNSSQDIYLVKLNRCGEAACNEMNVVYTAQEREMNYSDPSSYVTSHGTLSSITATVNHYDIRDSLLCEFDPICQLRADFTSDTVCLGDSTSLLDLSWDSLANVTGWQWTFGDGDSIWNVQNPKHVYTTVGVFNTRLVVFNDDTVFCSDTVEKMVSVLDFPPVNLGNDTSFCYGQTHLLIAGSSLYTYLWYDSSTLINLPVDTTGIYWVRANNAQCSSTDTIELTFDIPPIVDLGNDTILCRGQKLVLGVTIPAATFLWSDSSTSSSTVFQNTGKYWLRVRKLTCSVSDTISLTVEDSLNLQLGPDTVLCQGMQIQLNAFNPNATYLWSDSSTLPVLNIFQTGKYSVQLWSQLGSCHKNDSIAIDFDTAPVSKLPADTENCEGITLQLDPGVTNAGFLWDDLSTVSTRMVSTSGTYFITIDSGACRITDTVKVVIWKYPLVNLNDEYPVCRGEGITIKLDNSYQKYNWSNGSTNSSTYFKGNSKQWVEASNGPCYSSDTFSISVKPLPDSVKEHYYILCNGMAVLLDAENPGSTYFWSTGSQEQRIRVTVPGEYKVVITNNFKCTLTEQFDISQCFEDLVIPNTITPNGDGKNDRWVIKNIDQYPSNNIRIFNPNGQLLYESTNYANNWDATYNGRELPSTVYFYLLDLGDGSDILEGTITVIREK